MRDPLATAEFFIFVKDFEKADQYRAELIQKGII